MNTVSIFLYPHKTYHYFHTFLPPWSSSFLKVYIEYLILSCPCSCSIEPNKGSTRNKFLLIANHISVFTLFYSLKQQNPYKHIHKTQGVNQPHQQSHTIPYVIHFIVLNSCIWSFIIIEHLLLSGPLVQHIHQWNLILEVMVLITCIQHMGLLLFAK